MWCRKRKGPRALPSGMQALAAYFWSDLPSRTTSRGILLKNHEIRWKNQPEILQKLSL